MKARWLVLLATTGYVAYRGVKAGGTLGGPVGVMVAGYRDIKNQLFPGPKGPSIVQPPKTCPPGLIRNTAGTCVPMCIDNCGPGPGGMR